MTPVYTNRPRNRPVPRRGTAGKTLAVMSAVLAMMFGVKLLCDPIVTGNGKADAGRSDSDAGAIAVNALPYDTDEAEETEETTAETTDDAP